MSHGRNGCPPASPFPPSPGSAAGRFSAAGKQRRRLRLSMETRGLGVGWQLTSGYLHPASSGCLVTRRLLQLQEQSPSGTWSRRRAGSRNGGFPWTKQTSRHPSLRNSLVGSGWKAHRRHREGWESECRAQGVRRAVTGYPGPRFQGWAQSCPRSGFTWRGSRAQHSLPSKEANWAGDKPKEAVGLAAGAEFES